MKETHKKSSFIFYLVLTTLFLLTFSATYVNLHVNQNFKMFTADEPEPKPLDFYLHSNYQEL
jgi:exopolysaccharide biosynthesis protein